MQYNDDDELMEEKSFKNQADDELLDDELDDPLDPLIDDDADDFNFPREETE